MTASCEPISLYTVRVRCDNCGDINTLSVPRGRPIHQVECPNCDCRYLKRQDLSPEEKAIMDRLPEYFRVEGH